MENDRGLLDLIPSYSFLVKPALMVHMGETNIFKWHQFSRFLPNALEKLTCFVPEWSGALWTPSTGVYKATYIFAINATLKCAALLSRPAVKEVVKCIFFSFPVGCLCLWNLAQQLSHRVEVEGAAAALLVPSSLWYVASLHSPVGEDPTHPLHSSCASCVKERQERKRFPSSRV